MTAGSETYGALAARGGDETVAPRSIGQWALVWRRFARHSLAFWSMRVLLLLIVLAIVGPSLAPSVPFNTFAQHIPLDAPPRLWPFDLRYFMGTDHYGVSVSTSVLAGARASLEIGIIGALIASVAGALIGAIAGYFGRLVDALLMRVVDALLTVPFLPFLMLLSTQLPDRSTLTFAFMFGLVGWPAIARLIRGNVLSLGQREFAEASRALGATDLRVIVRHLLPNTLDILIVATTLNVALFIVAEVSLEFIVGAAAGPAAFTWGGAFADAYANMPHGDWWTLFFPAIFLLLTVLSVNFIGDGLRDALDVAAGNDVGDPGKRPHLEARAMSLLLAGARLAGRPMLALAVSPPMMGARKRANDWRAAAAARVDRLLPRARPGRASLFHRVYGSPPWWLRVVPIVLVVLVGEAVMLYSHSPLIYAPNFDAPVQYSTAVVQAAFAGVPLPGGGWRVQEFEPVSKVVLITAGAGGRTTGSVMLAGDGNDTSTATLAEGHGADLAAWLSQDDSTLEAALVRGSRVRRFALTPSTGTIEHPFATRIPGGFVVVYGWYRPSSAFSPPIQIYASVVSTSGTMSRPIRLVANRRHALFPHALTDAAGRLDLWYMDYLGNDQWAWRFQRFTPQLSPLGKPLTLEQVGYAPRDRNNHIMQDAVPTSWAFGATADGHGNVWALWADDQGTSFAEWDTRGKLSFPPTPLQNGGGGTGGISLPTPFAMAPRAKGFQLYTQYGDAHSGSSIIAVQGYDGNANPIAPLGERVAYNGGGPEVDPQAATLNGQTHLLWDRVRLSGSIIEGTVFHASKPPDLLTRFGLNIGNLWVNILLVLAGSVAIGVVVGLANIAVVLLLLLLWGAIAKLVPSRLRLAAYMIAIGFVLVWLFNPAAGTPPFVFVIHGLDWPGGWVAALGGTFVAIWAGLFLFRRFESIFRAASMAAFAVLFVAVMYAVTLIQTQITVI